MSSEHSGNPGSIPGTTCLFPFFFQSFSLLLRCATDSLFVTHIFGQMSTVKCYYPTMVVGKLWFNLCLPFSQQKVFLNLHVMMSFFCSDVDKYSHSQNCVNLMWIDDIVLSLRTLAVAGNKRKKKTEWSAKQKHKSAGRTRNRTGVAGKSNMNQNPE